MSLREFSAPGAVPYNVAGPARWLLSHLSRYKRAVACLLLTTVVGQALFLRIQVLTGHAFDAVLRGSTSSAPLLHTTFLILLMALLFGLLDLAGRVASAVLGSGLERDVRDEFVLALLSTEQRFHNRQRVGELLARATGDARQIGGMMVGVDVIATSFLSLIMTLAYIGSFNPHLLLAPLLFTAAFLPALRAYTRHVTPLAADLRASYGTLSAQVTEAITGIAVVKAAGREERERDAFATAAGRYQDLFARMGRVQAWYVPPLLLAIAIAGGFLHGLLLVESHQLTIGGLVAYMGLLFQLRYPASISDWTFNLVGTGLATARRMTSLLRDAASVGVPASGQRGRIAGDITFEQVTFGYGQTPALRAVSFTVRAGQTVAIVGRTGAGKSTLTALVTRIYDADAGRVLIDGVDVRAWDLATLRAQVAPIEQDALLVARSIADNIAFGRPRSRAEVERAARDAQVHDAIISLPAGYDTILGPGGVTLSGGQRQRLTIARAVLDDPRILILDDATSAVDSATEDAIQHALRRLMRGRTTLLITHRLSLLSQADLVLVLHRGRLLDSGAHQDLLERCPPYRHIVTPDDPRPARAGATGPA